MYKDLLIFDLDGTLVDTVKDLNQSLNYAFSKNGFPSKSVEHTAHAIGNGIFITIKRSVSEGTADEMLNQILSDFRSHYKDHCLDNSLPYAGMKGALLVLKKYGYKLAVATNKLDEIAKKIINELYPNIFDMIQGDSPEFEKKPNPAIINHIAKTLKVDKRCIVYIGDSEVDIESATNAHVDLILCDYGFHRTDEFLRIAATRIKKPQDLLAVLNIK